jgi:serine/threonine-protein kinase
MIGTRIGVYRLVRELGRGGMGVVYAADHDDGERRAAIKVIQPSLTLRRDVVARFVNEARAAAAIEDPGIVQVFDVGEHEGHPYLVMELLAGETVEARLRRVGPLAVRDALRITRQIASTLARAHAVGIVHRDLKPDNLFLIRDDEVAGGERTKVLDFGIAKLMAPGADVMVTGPGERLGTPMYMSPEQCRGETVDLRTDVYALGAVLFRMLTGRALFDKRNPADLIVAHLRESPVRPSALAPAVPASTDAVVLRCLEKDPELRYPSMAELGRALDDALERAGPPRPSSMQTPRLDAALNPSLLGDTLPAGGDPTRAPGARRRLGGALVIAVIAAVTAVAVALARGCG